MPLPAKWSKFVKECAKTYAEKRGGEPQIGKRLVAHLKRSVPEEHREEALFTFRELMQETKKRTAAPPRKRSKAKVAAAPKSPARRGGTPPPPYAEAVADAAAAAADDDDDDDYDDFDDDAEDPGDVDSDGADDEADEFERAFVKGHITAEDYADIRRKQQDDRRGKITWTLQTGDTDDEEDELYALRHAATIRIIANKREQLAEIQAEIASGKLSKAKLKSHTAWAKRLAKEISHRESEL